MDYTYSQIKTGLDEISGRIVSNRNQLASAKAQIATAEGALGGMAVQYTPLVQAVDQALAAEPENPALAAAKAEKDKLVAEFLALQAVATSMKTALAAIEV
jgi:hypothetical protein